MGHGGRVRLGIAEGLQRRHLDVIARGGVKGLVSSGADVGLGVGEKGFGLLDAFDLLRWWVGQRVVMLGQSLALFGIEDGVFLQEGNIGLDLVAVFGLLLLLEGAGIDDG